MNKGMVAMANYVLVLAFLAGAWLLIAPQWVGYQSPHGPLAVSSKSDLWTAVILMGASVLTWLLTWLFGLSQVMREHRSRAFDK
jgi:hypothetical protein